jgi:phosphomannomutase|tara:strand:+ start:17605 stop:18972 length:1368 start_codon:yes stop_codon:yes gene_type:complete
MKINPDIFRLYDIRGIYPKNLNEESAYQVARTFIRFLQKRSGNQKLKIALGKDIRKSSPILFKGFSNGILKEGSDLTDFGLITTPMLYFAVSNFGFDGGVVITASHNPNPYNGLKLVRERAIPLSGPKGIFWIRDYLLKNGHFLKKPRQGKIFKRNIEKAYLDFSLKLAGIKKNEFQGFSLAVDAGNGIAGPITLKLLKELGIKVFPLYCRPDGSFPNHSPDPLLKENLKDIISLVKKKKPDFGIALDGDGDRIIFIDEKGQAVSGDLITALLAKIILKKRKGLKILYDVRSSRAVEEVIRENRGKPIPFRIGHALIKEKMRKDNIIFGGELSGHYYLGQNLFYDMPFFVLLKILKEIKENKVSLSSLIKPLKRYYYSGEINFKIKNKKGKIKELKKRYKSGKVLEIDGLRVEFNDWWFLVRPSNTEAVLRLIVEAETKTLLFKKKRELTKAIKQ